MQNTLRVILNNLKEKRFILFFIITIFVFNYVYAEDLSLFRQIVEENSRIKSIEADIIQYVITPEHSKEIFKGKYRADKKGRFRIDYTTPSNQIVLNDGRCIYWYYPDERLLYKIVDKEKILHRSSINPLKEFSKDFDKNFKIHYLGKHLYGFFRYLISKLSS